MPVSAHVGPRRAHAFAGKTEMLWQSAALHKTGLGWPAAVAVAAAVALAVLWAIRRTRDPALALVL